MPAIYFIFDDGKIIKKEGDFSETVILENTETGISEVYNYDGGGNDGDSFSNSDYSETVVFFFDKEDKGLPRILFESELGGIYTSEEFFNLYDEDGETPFAIHYINSEQTKSEIFVPPLFKN